MLLALLGTIGGTSTTPTTVTLSQLCGELQTNAADELNTVPEGNLQFWIDLTSCFDAVFLNNASFQVIEAVRVSTDALTPTGLPAIAVKNYSMRMCLVEQARVLAATDFTSRQDIDRYFNIITASFNEAIEVAAGNLDNVAYVALISLFAAVSDDLETRARPLPKMVTYKYPMQRSSLWIAQNLYQDPSRSAELIAENKPIHPLFMPHTGRALSF